MFHPCTTSTIMRRNHCHPYPILRCPCRVHKGLSRIGQVYTPITSLCRSRRPCTTAPWSRCCADVSADAVLSGGVHLPPVSGKTCDTLNQNAHDLCNHTVTTRFRDLSFHQRLFRAGAAAERMLAWTEPDAVNIALPSLRCRQFLKDLMGALPLSASRR
jgi:hypothetical protein